jgi:hypothetical protein
LICLRTTGGRNSYMERLLTGELGDVLDRLLVADSGPYANGN